MSSPISSLFLAVDFVEPSLNPKGDCPRSRLFVSSISQERGSGFVAIKHIGELHGQSHIPLQFDFSGHK